MGLWFIGDLMKEIHISKVETFDDVDNMFDDVDNMFDDINKRFKERQPFHYWFDEFTKDWWWPFPFVHHVIYSSPQMIISDWFYEIKYAWQRVFRGWDDTVLWGIDDWVSGVMLEVLPEFKKIKLKIPSTCLPKDYHENENNYSDDENSKIQNDAVKLWDRELDIMIDGFKAYKQMHELHGWKTIDEHHELEKRLVKGLQKFSEYYLDLWD